MEVPLEGVVNSMNYMACDFSKIYEQESWGWSGESLYLKTHTDWLESDNGKAEIQPSIMEHSLSRSLSHHCHSEFTCSSGCDMDPLD